MLSRFSELFDAFEEVGEQLFIAGGFVRDYLLYIPSDDIDFATSARPEKTIEILEGLKLPVILLGTQFGTIGTIYQNQKLEITTFRSKESYTTGNRKPSVIFGTDLKEDLRRRDFTINSLAMDRNSQIFDFFGGREDIKNRIIRTPGPPAQAFLDDPLRLLRACRFVAKLGAELDIVTLLAAKDYAEEILNIKPERIAMEMTKLLMTEDPSEGLKLMGCIGLTKYIFPELETLRTFKNDQGIYHSKKIWEHTVQVIANCSPKKELRWAALFHDVGKPTTFSIDEKSGIHFYGHEAEGERIWRQIANRLKMSNEFTDYVGYLIFEHLQPSLLCATLDSPTAAGKKAIRRFIRRAGSEEKLNDILDLSRADITSHREELVADKLKRLSTIREAISEIFFETKIQKVRLPKHLGLKVISVLSLESGPEVGRIMKVLEQWMIDGELDPENITDEDIRKAAK